MSFPFRQTSRLRPAGFTVLELIVALTLGLVLLSAIWTMFRLFLRHQEIETAQVEKVQLVSSLHHLLSHELLNLVPGGKPGPGSAPSPAIAPPSTSPASPLQTFPSPTSGLSLFPDPFGLLPSLPGSEDQSQTIQFSYELPSRSLVGDSHRLELVVFSSFEELIPNEEPSTGSTRSLSIEREQPARLPSKQVIYEFVQPDLENGLSGNRDFLGLDGLESELDNDEEAMQQTGLWRRESTAQPATTNTQNYAPTETRSLENPPSSSPQFGSELSQSASPSDPRGTESGSQVEEFAPEIIDLRFDYFDGQRWLTSWDSGQKNQLPVLVRARLAVETRPDIRKRKLEERAESATATEPQTPPDDRSLLTSPRPGATETLDPNWDYQFLIFVSPPADDARNPSRQTRTPIGKPGNNSLIPTSRPQGSLPR